MLPHEEVLDPTFHLITSSLMLHILADTTSTRRIAMSLPTMNCAGDAKRVLCDTTFDVCDHRPVQCSHSPADSRDCSSGGPLCIPLPKRLRKSASIATRTVREALWIPFARDQIRNLLTILHYRACPIQRDAILPRQLSPRIPIPLGRRPGPLLPKVVYQQRHPVLLLEHVVLLRLAIRRHDDRLLLGQIREPHEREVGRGGADVDGAEVREAAPGEDATDDVGQWRAERLGGGVADEVGEEGCVLIGRAARARARRMRQLVASTCTSRSATCTVVLTSLCLPLAPDPPPLLREALLPPRQVDHRADEQRRREGGAEELIFGWWHDCDACRVIQYCSRLLCEPSRRGWW